MAAPRRHIVILFVFIIFCMQGQDLEDLTRLPEGPRTAKENVGMLFKGLGMNILGVAGMAGTVYWWINMLDSEEYLIPTGTFTASLGLAVIGTFMMIKSASSMIQTRKSYHHLKKSKSDNLNITIEPTQYGLGIVYRF